jgi:hypothetical protein
MARINIWKKIKKYKRLRNTNDGRIDTKVLKDIYKKATPEWRVKYEQEMDAYIKAVESGRIKAGEPLN